MFCTGLRGWLVVDELSVRRGKLPGRKGAREQRGRQGLLSRQFPLTRRYSPVAQSTASTTQSAAPAPSHSPLSSSLPSAKSGTQPSHSLVAAMTTQIPPAPKRQKMSVASANTIDRSAPAPTIVTQFKSKDGTLIGPPVSLPADTSREGLELLVNNLRGSVSSSLLSSFALHSALQS